MMNAPAHCAVTRAEMAKKSCDGCAEGLGAFADAEITLENTENGAQAVIIGKDKEHASELKAFFASNIEDSKTE